MSGKMSDERKVEARRLYTEEGWTQEAIAGHFGVSTRTIERWCKDGGWSALKTSTNVVQLKPKAQSPKSKPASSPPPQREARSPRQQGELDEMQIVETAIWDISAAMSIASSEDGDLRSLGGLAGGLCRLIELRLRLQPPTAAELAEQMIALGISPSEMVAELKQRWQQRA